MVQLICNMINMIVLNLLSGDKLVQQHVVGGEANLVLGVPQQRSR